MIEDNRPSLFNIVRELSRRATDARLGGYIASALRYEKAYESIAREMIDDAAFAVPIEEGVEIATDAFFLRTAQDGRLVPKKGEDR